MPKHTQTAHTDVSPEQIASELLNTADLSNLSAEDIAAHYEQVRIPVRERIHQIRTDMPAPLDLSRISADQHDACTAQYLEDVQAAHNRIAQRKHWTDISQCLQCQTETHVVQALRRDEAAGWTDAQFSALWFEAYQRGHAEGISGTILAFTQMAEAVTLFIKASADAGHPHPGKVAGAPCDLTG